MDFVVGQFFEDDNKAFQGGFYLLLSNQPNSHGIRLWDAAYFPFYSFERDEFKGAAIKQLYDEDIEKLKLIGYLRQFLPESAWSLPNHRLSQTRMLIDICQWCGARNCAHGQPLNHEQGCPKFIGKEIEIEKWDHDYRLLKKGELIRDSDEVDACNVGWRDKPNWEPAGKTVGEMAPDPSYPAHRRYRRRIDA